MTDIPIIFSAPMVRALQDGRKTMTRRQAQGKPVHHNNQKLRPGDKTAMVQIGSTSLPMLFRASHWQKVKPGDRLWVRETWADDAEAQWEPQERGTYYRADPDAEEVRRDNLSCGIPHAWRPAIHMKRWRSRLTLVVTATKIERLQDICEADAQAEGVPHQHNVKWLGGDPGTIHDVCRRNFYALWCQLHGPESWDANPEVVALTFTAHKCNIDRMEQAA